MKRIIFFAFQSSTKSGSSDNVDAIIEAAKQINQDGLFKAQTWQDLQNNGRVLINAILEAIDSCQIFACDLTYLNHNVLFELGYAIAKNKILFILLNNKVQNASINLASIDILRTVGYSTFSNSQDICTAIKKVPGEPQLLHDLSLLGKKVNVTNDVFYIRNASNSQAELDTSKLLENSDYKVHFDDSAEVEYRPFANYLEYIMNSNALIVHITNTNYSSSFEDNAKASLFAGFAYGQKKQVLLLAPDPYRAPIDYVDIMIQYNGAADCVAKVQSWITRHITSLASGKLKNEDTEFDLLKLGLGYDIAENEKDQLSNYFVKTNAYAYAEKHNRVFFIGRKGTGKTAIYIMLCKSLNAVENTFVIDLKPESSELLNNVEVTNLYSSAAQKQSLFHSIWKFVIYSKLIIEISNRTQKKFIDEGTLEFRIHEFVKINMALLSKHFLEVINEVSTQTTKNPLANVYETLINPVLTLVKEYFGKTKYLRIAIIADNLDKTWDIKSNLEIQTSMILNLFEVTGAIETTLKCDKQSRVESKVILFLRKDIFEYILRQAREPDKLILNKQEIDWANYPDQLKSVIEKRFEYILDLQRPNEIAEVWRKYFSFKLPTGKTTFDKIRDACIPRPRDLLMFMGHMFESAVNNGHSKVTESDFENALREYSAFLYQNLVAEMISEYPEVRTVLDHLHNRYMDKIEFIKLKSEIESIQGNPHKTDLFIDALIDNGYFVLSNMKTGEKYRDFYEAERAYQGTCRKILWFTYRPKKTTICAILTPQYSKLVK